jgi:hypothetical protein
VIRTESRRPGPLTVRLLRLQYWYDRLSDPRRLLVGLALIAFLGSCLLYVLGLTSYVMVSRMDPFDEPGIGDVEPAEGQAAPPAPAPQSIPTQPSGQPSAPTAAPTATPAVEAGGPLIAPPEVPEVPVIWSPPRFIEPAPQPIKPRVVATSQTPIRTAAPTPPPNGTRSPGSSTVGTPGPTPPRTPGLPNGVPTNGVPGNGRAPGPATPTPRPGQLAGATATPPAPSKPAAPPAATKPAAQPSQPNPTSRAR